MQSRETANSSKTSQNHTSAPITNPFQARTFDVDTPKEPKLENTESEQVEEAAKQPEINLRHIPAYPPGTTPPTRQESLLPSPIFENQSRKYEFVRNPVLSPSFQPIQRQEISELESETNIPGTTPPARQESLLPSPVFENSSRKYEFVRNPVIPSSFHPIQRQEISPTTELESESNIPEEQPEINLRHIPVYPPGTTPPPRQESLLPSPVFENQSRKYEFVRHSVVSPEPTQTVQLKGNESKSAPVNVEESINSKKGSGEGLADNIRQPMEEAFGADFGGVKIHADGESDQLNQSLSSRAFATGQDIFFKQGAYNPGSRDGQELLAHELTHVVQQNGGTVQPTQINNQLIQKQPADPRLQGTSVSKNGVAFYEAGLELYDQPSKNHSSILRKIPIGTKLFIDKELSSGWYHIALSSGEYGYVEATKINTRLPEPGAEIHKVKSGENAIGIAEHYYKQSVQPGRDLRFYVNVLEEINRQGGGIHRPPNSAWENTQAKTGVYIWIPSVAFANSFVGQVSSGSSVRDALKTAGNVAKTVGDFAVGGAALVAGVLEGALESLWSNLVGIKDLAVMVWDILKSLVTGNILNDGQNLWNKITGINWGDLAQAWLGDFQKKWNEPDLWKKWQFRGWVIGYAITEIALAVLTFGGVTGAKWAGKISAKAIQVIKEIPGVAKLAAQVSKIPVPAPIKKGLEQLGKIKVGKKTQPGKGSSLDSGLANRGYRPKSGERSTTQAQWRNQERSRRLAQSSLTPIKDAIIKRVKTRIASQSDKFKLTYSEADLERIIRKGKKLGLSDRVIEDLIYTGSREAKAISSLDLIQQMEHWTNVISKRGFPEKFFNKAEFHEFSKDLLNGVQKAGLSTNDVKIQGSSLRKATANDVDVAVFVDKATFDSLLVKRYHQKIAFTQGEKISLEGKSHSELLQLADDIRANPGKYNAQARTFQNALHNGIISSKSDIIKALKNVRANIAQKYPNLNLEAISVLIKDGLFDTKPDLPIKNN